MTYPPEPLWALSDDGREHFWCLTPNVRGPVTRESPAAWRALEAQRHAVRDMIHPEDLSEGM